MNVATTWLLKAVFVVGVKVWGVAVKAASAIASAGVKTRGVALPEVTVTVAV
jgi:hypothetical protein